MLPSLGRTLLNPFLVRAAAAPAPRTAKPVATAIALCSLACTSLMVRAGESDAKVALGDSIREVARVAGTTPADAPIVVADALTAGQTDAPLDIEFPLRLRNFEDLQARIERGEIIGAAELRERYLPADTDYAAVTQWLQANDFTITRTSDTRLAVFARAPVSTVSRALNTQFARVSYRGVESTAAITVPSLPSSIAAAVVGVNGLQPYARHLAREASPIAAQPPVAAAAAPYTAAQVAKVYNADGLAVTGAGEKIAIIIDAFPAAADLNAFWAAAKSRQTAANVEQVQVVGGTLPADSREATLDVSWSGAMAPDAKLRVYATADLDPVHVDQAYEQLIRDLPSQPALHQLSLSFGSGETYKAQAQLQTEFQYMAILAASGVSVFASSGDGGSNPGSGSNSQVNGNGPLQTSAPASNPFVTGVGGTSLVLDANTGALVSESAWGNGGGGLSLVYSRPGWQSGTGVPAGTMRVVPDVAAVADAPGGLALYVNGQASTTGGTSVSAPVWAGFSALINQARANAGRGPIGLLNSKLYRLVGTGSFRDITTGNNGAYSAGPGYDACTGAGVANVAVLVRTLAAMPIVTQQPVAQSVNVGQTVAFTVAAAGSSGVTFQWQRRAAGTDSWVNLSNDGTFSGVTSPTLTLTGVTAAQAGDQYQCVVSNADGADTSTAAGLNVDIPYNVSTFAGANASYGSTDGPGTAARFAGPYGVATDAAGNVYVADYTNHCIRRITPQGLVSTFAGVAGNSGSSDGAAGVARFLYPTGIAVDAAGNVIVADSGNHTLRRISQGIVATLAGTAGSSGTLDGTGAAARFSAPRGLAADASGNIYVADYGNHTIRRVTSDGTVSTIAGAAGVSGTTDGTATNARFYYPRGVAVDRTGVIYVADWGNSAVRRIGPGGVVTTFAGLPSLPGNADGTGTAARMYAPIGIAVDRQGNVWVADSLNNSIRRIQPNGATTTPLGLVSTSGATDGFDTNARFSVPYGLAFDAAGTLYIGDFSAGIIRKAVPDASTAFGPAIIGAPPQIVSMDGGDAATISLVAHGNPAPTYRWQRRPKGGAWTDLAESANYSGTASASLTITAATYAMDGDQFQCVVTNASGSMTPAATTLAVNVPYLVSTLAGRTTGRADGTGADAQFFDPRAVAVDRSGNAYVADSLNDTIRKITPAGVVTTIAGVAGSSGSLDGTGTAARFNGPSGIAVDGSGNIYVSDSGNYTIRKITPAGVVSTLAGVAGAYGFTDGTGTAARFGTPYGMAVDSAGNVYVADYYYDTIRKITPAGVVTTLAGSATQDSGSADGVGVAARFYGPESVAVDAAGNVYVADTLNHTIRKITPGYAVTTVAGLAGVSGTADGAGSAARFSRPRGIAVDAAGNLFVADTYNDMIRKITPAGVVTTIAGSPLTMGAADGIGRSAHFYSPSSIALDGNGNFYIADAVNDMIRKIAAPTPVAAPAIKTAPADVTSTPGQPVTLTVSTSGNPAPQFQWQRNGVNIPGATGPTLAFSSVQVADAGSYTAVLTNPAGTLTTPAATITVTFSRISNLSVRSNAGIGDQSLIVGFALAGGTTGASKSLLLRAVGPSLAPFGVTGFLPDPTITLRGGTAAAVVNDNWAGDAQVTSVGTHVGAFPLAAATSKDAALVTAQVAGSYTAQIGSGDTGRGNALFEIYDAANPSEYTSSAPKLVNVSARTQVGTDDGILIVGFVVDGNSKKKVLIRAIGPTLAKFGVDGALLDPTLAIYKAGATNPMANNDDWGGASDLAAIFNQVGAFALDPTAKDAAVVVSLDPGAYTAQVTGVNRTTGVALVEVYEVP